MGNSGVLLSHVSGLGRVSSRSVYVRVGIEPDVPEQVRTCAPSLFPWERYFPHFTQGEELLLQFYSVTCNPGKVSTRHVIRKDTGSGRRGRSAGNTLLVKNRHPKARPAGKRVMSTDNSFP
ncbi:hypothetical protein Bbelb_296010 [Branchiostoma belcheri]|nr:hypothetical protein Bbelb_296010 [Branchiostoma belcheri]